MSRVTHFCICAAVWTLGSACHPVEMPARLTQAAELWSCEPEGDHECPVPDTLPVNTTLWADPTVYGKTFGYYAVRLADGRRGYIVSGAGLEIASPGGAAARVHACSEATDAHYQPGDSVWTGCLSRDTIGQLLGRAVDVHRMERRQSGGWRVTTAPASGQERGGFGEVIVDVSGSVVRAFVTDGQ